MSRLRPYAFWILVAAFLILIVAYDQSAFYLYVSRAWVVLLSIVLICPALYLLSVDKRFALAAMTLAALSPYIISPFAATKLKRFYLDCSAIEQGETKDQVSAHMAGYSASLDAWGGSQASTVSEAPNDSGSTPFIYTPSPEYDADFCMVYLVNGVVERAVLAPD